MHQLPGNCTRAALCGLAALVLTVAISSAACRQDTTTVSAQPATTKRAEMHSVTVPVEGMICMVCAGRVKNALKAVDGVENAEVNLEQHTATVHYGKSGVNVDDLARAINQLGYKAGLPTSVQLPQ